MIASDNWTQREAALKRLAEECRTTTSGNESALWSKTVGAVARLVRDKVTPVFLASSAALQAAALRCGSSIARDDLLDGLRKVLPALLHRTGNVHSRIRAECVSTFSALSRATGPAFIVDSLVVDVPQGKQLAPHLVRASSDRRYGPSHSAYLP